MDLNLQDLSAAMDVRRDKLMFFAGTMVGEGGPQVGYGCADTTEYRHKDMVWFFWSSVPLEC